MRLYGKLAPCEASMLAWATMGGFLTRPQTTINHGAISAHDTYVAVTIGTK